MKINVVGTSGSGKSTLSRQLAEALSVPYVEMDRLFWEKHWREPEDEVFFERLETALQASAWVLDGNYTRTMPIKWRSVQAVVWVDYSFPRTLYQALKRALQRSITQVELWPGTGNRESFARLFSRDSIVWWTISHYHRNRKKYWRLMRDPEYAHIHFIRLSSPRASARLLANLKVQGAQALRPDAAY